MKRRLGAIAGGLLASALWLGPSWAATTFKWANDGDVGAMDPYTREETVQLSFLGNIYEPLVRRSADLKLQPALATSWEMINPTTWRFHLRPGVKWQDGSPFTADDVVFSFNRIMSKTSVMRDVMASVKDAKKVDDLTVDFDMKQVGSDLSAGTVGHVHRLQGVDDEARRSRSGHHWRHGGQLRRPQRDGHRPVPSRLA